MSVLFRAFSITNNVIITLIFACLGMFTTGICGALTLQLVDRTLFGTNALEHFEQTGQSPVEVALHLGLFSLMCWLIVLYCQSEAITKTCPFRQGMFYGMVLSTILVTKLIINGNFPLI